MSTWIEKAEEFVALAFCSRGKYMSLSRMITPSDVSNLQTSEFVCSYRPRGILSGFLVIHPLLHYAVFLPSPSQTKLHPQRFHVRVAPSVLENGGMIALAYLYNKQLVLEDLVFMDGKTVWQNQPFIERWTRLKGFLESEFRNDRLLQDGVTITTTSYFPLAELVEPPSDKVVEFVACRDTGPAHKRLLWIPPRDPLPATGVSPPTGGGSGTIHIAKQESAMGPDVYSLYEGDKKLGLALVRTLAVSKALRIAFTEAVGASDAAIVRVTTVWNKQFDKWEILGVVS